MNERERAIAANAWESGYLAGHFSALQPNARTPENPFVRDAEQPKDA